ncbi:helix-turn-helix transcriptional regulator [Mycolicibacterium arenosum]|uniref:LuxR C-terminal-related transcriptional regulator n=1 Tax=Mycolicibacterium arenosum TaxID=2952157 RepID=A0ABT1M690_9MYCO|nr:LuxR family transcriptional regulator [Mycolicibacterium sp. CAU 1645]MCP9274327.1 LuxR C-terminal-related transcriptional regulator [Mycolicibacterium sp. CAU 1645]
MVQLAGRTELGHRLANWWLQARHGRGRVIVLLGDPGVGKTTTLSWLADHVGGAARIISCHGGDLGTPMATAAELVAALSVGDTEDDIGLEVDPLKAAAILRHRLEHSDAMALLIDDIHDADPSSRTALNLALRQALLGGVLVVVTGRRVSAALAFSEGFDLCELDRLEPAAAREVLNGATTAPIAEPVVERLLTLADGNPLALTYLPKSLSSEQLSGAHLLPDDIPIVGDLRTVFTRELPQPGTSARDLLELAAVSADGSWAILKALRPTTADGALAVLEESGLANVSAGRLTLRHPLLRAAVLHPMPLQRLRQLNLELAAAPSLTAEVRLAHRAHAAVGPDDRLVDEIVDAARLLRLRGGTDAAARMLDRAVELTGNDSRRARLRMEAAELLAAAGVAPAARHRLEAVLGDPSARDLHIAATVTLATLEALDGAPARAWQRLVQCAATAGPSESGVVHARMAVPLGMLGLVTQIADSAELAVENSKPDSTESAIAKVVLAHARSALNEDGVRDRSNGLLADLDMAAAVQQDPMLGLHIGRVLSIAEDYEGAAAALLELIAMSRGEGARTSLAMTFGALGETHVRASRFDEAMACLDEAIALSLATGQRAFAPFWLALRARVHAIRGDDVESEADLSLGFDISDSQSTFGARYFLLANAGLVALSAKRIDDAVGYLAECWAFEQATALLAPQLARWHADLVDAYVEAGRHAEAEPLVGHLVHVATRPGSTRWTKATACRARACIMADSDPAAALAQLKEAAMIFHPEFDRFDRARVFMSISTLDPTHNGREEARREALHTFRRLGATPWAARLSTRDPVGLSGLTESERRVLNRVAEGLTNKQIAKSLNVSGKTVANHLYNVYRKLGVASRTEAARRVLLDDHRHSR